MMAHLARRQHDPSARRLLWSVRAALVLALPLALQPMPGLAGWTEQIAPLPAAGAELLRSGMQRQPAAMLAGGVAVLLPFLALLAALLRLVGRGAARLRAREVVAVIGPATGGRPGARAWITVAGAGVPPVTVGELTRIGGSPDCELVVSGAGLAEMHAIIQRTPEAEFYVLDVSADPDAHPAVSGGVSVNGARARRRRLRDGDRIELGNACVHFHLGNGGLAPRDHPGLVAG